MKTFTAAALIGIAALIFSIVCQTATLHAASEPETTQVLFHNLTEATVRIDTITAADEATALPVIVKPNSEVSIPVTAGKRIFEFLAFRANPIRLHRVSIDVAEGKTSHYHFIPHAMGLYLLEDADGQASITEMPIANQNEAASATKAVDVGIICKAPSNSLERSVIWDEGAPLKARYFRKVGTFLCAVDGSGAFHTGQIYEHYICSNEWQDCVRHSNGDALLVRLIRTSHILDTALLLAILQDPRTYFAETQTLEWLRNGRVSSRLTNYQLYATLTSKKQCPLGYRLHSEGLCFNIEDEILDIPQVDVRKVEPSIQSQDQ